MDNLALILAILLLVLCGWDIYLQLKTPKKKDYIYTPSLAHQFCTRNRASIEKSSKAGCFYCRTMFNPSTITEWIDDELTAMCPICEIDSVICNLDVPDMDLPFLNEMHKRWFKTLFTALPDGTWKVIKE